MYFYNYDVVVMLQMSPRIPRHATDCSELPQHCYHRAA